MFQNIFEEKVLTLNSQGQGICSINGFKVFVDGALPGEVIKAKMTLKKKNYGQADLLEIKKRSPYRDNPICPHFSVCGGCQIMHLQYPEQLKYKTQIVEDAIRKIGSFNIKVDLAEPSFQPLYYRNKIQLPIFEENNEVKLGLYQKKSNTPFPIQKCFIHCPLGEKVFQNAYKLLKESNLQPYIEKTQQGVLRHLLIKSGIKTQECLVVWICSSKKEEKALSLISEKLVLSCPEIKGVLLNINKKRHNSILGDQIKLLFGRPYIYEKLLGKTFKISAHSFFQVNPSQAEKLYQKALDFADLQKDEIVFDAYCGTGTLSILIAPYVQKVIGIESVLSAVTDANKNAALNNIENAEFIQGLVEEKISDLKKVDTVFLNPPRKGCEREVLESIEKLRPKKIVYISCAPATLARDLKILSEKGYQLKEVKPFDMFPQTTHVETCALLTL